MKDINIIIIISTVALTSLALNKSNIYRTERSEQLPFNKRKNSKIVYSLAKLNYV